MMMNGGLISLLVGEKKQSYNYNKTFDFAFYNSALIGPCATFCVSI